MICSSVNRAFFIVRPFRADSTQIWRIFRGSRHWAHTRRGFFDEWEHHKSPTAKQALDRIAVIYVVEARAGFAPLAAATVKMQPFNVTFDRIGGTRGQFLLRASHSLATLIEFRQSLNAALTKVGLRGRVNQLFNPHMTLSYDFSDAPEQKINPISWTVTHFALTESLLGKHKHIKRGSWKIKP